MESSSPRLKHLAGRTTRCTVYFVEVKLVMVPPWTPDRMTEDARDQLGIL